MRLAAIATAAIATAVICALAGGAMAEKSIMPWPASSVAERAGRYYGVVFRKDDPDKHDSLALVIDRNGGVTAEGLAVADVQVTRDTIALRLVGARPRSLPERLRGRFVRQGPPANAKGPVEEGILFDGTAWFLVHHRQP